MNFDISLMFQTISNKNSIITITAQEAAQKDFSRPRTNPDSRLSTKSSVGYITLNISSFDVLKVENLPL